MDEELGLKHITLPVLSVLMVLGNGMLIYIIGRHKTLWTVTNFFVLSLALSDLLLGLVILPLMVAAEDGVLGESPVVCLRVFSVAIAQTLVSCLTLMAIALERYLAITRPLQHHAYLTTRTSLIVIVCCWVYSTIIGALPWLGWNVLSADDNESVGANTTVVEPWQCRYQTVVSGSFVAFMYPGHFVPLWIAMLVLYAQIYLRSRAHLPKDKVRRLSVSLGPGSGRELGRRNSTWRMKENWRALRILAFIVGYFVLSWLPVVVWYSLLFKGGTIHSAKDVEPSLPYWFYNVGITLAFGNSVVNPLLYGLGNRSVRRVWVQCCCRTNKKQQLAAARFEMCRRTNNNQERPLVDEPMTPE